MGKKLTIVLPAYNEEPNIPRVVERLQQLASGELPAPDGDRQPRVDMRDYDFEFLFVNDGSRDGTLRLLREAREKDPRVSIVNFSRNFGQDAAITAGLDAASGDAVIIMDCDLQHPPEYVPTMVYHWEHGGYDDVYGRRIDSPDESSLRAGLRGAFSKTLQGMCSTDLGIDECNFRLLDRKLVDAVREMPEKKDFIRMFISWAGFRKHPFSFRQRRREAGETSYSLGQLMTLALGTLLRFSTRPLRILTVAGFLTAGAGLLFLLTVAVSAICGAEWAGTQMFVIALIIFFGSLQLAAIGLVGEYVGMISMDVKHRPSYLVDTFEAGTPERPEKPEEQEKE